MHTAAHRQDSNLMGVALVAAMAGALAGLLLAPKRGTEMREDLRNRYYGMKDKTRDTVDTAKNKVEQGMDTARSKAKDVTDKISDKSSDIDDVSTDVGEELAKRSRNSRMPRS